MPMETLLPPKTAPQKTKTRNVSCFSSFLSLLELSNKNMQIGRSEGGQAGEVDSQTRRPRPQNLRREFYCQRATLVDVQNRRTGVGKGKLIGAWPCQHDAAKGDARGRRERDGDRSAHLPYHNVAEIDRCGAGGQDLRQRPSDVSHPRATVGEMQREFRLIRSPSMLK